MGKDARNICFAGGEKPIGIGPVLAGWEDGKPVYYADLLFGDGTTQRMVWAKAKRGADRVAKNEGYRVCNNLASALREGGVRVARLYDEASFEAIASVLKAPATRPAA